MRAIIEQFLAEGRALNAEQALWLYTDAPDDWLREMAQLRKEDLFGKEVYYNRNLHFEPTNKCVYSCKFCSFYRKPTASSADGAWDYTLKELETKLRSYPQGALTEIHITGGVHPDRGVEYACELIEFIRALVPEIHIKAFTAVELSFFARKSQISLEECLMRLKASGLGSLPGGGAEILDPVIRKKIAGGKAPAHTWLEVHRTAHRLGILSNATMLYGHIEEYKHRVHHMLQIRDLQEQTQGFMAFIPLRYRNENNALSFLPEVAPMQDLRNYAVSRLVMHNVAHLKAYWVMLGMDLALKSLHFGVDDLDGTIDDSTRIYSMAGGEQKPAMTSLDLCTKISAEGLQPCERNSLYQKLPA
jgi:aminodeoxyfutalosine synthase